MNQELIEILLSIYRIDENSKIILCHSDSGPKCKWLVSCSVCPLGRIHIPYGDNLHYLKHLIAIRERVNIWTKN